MQAKMKFSPAKTVKKTKAKVSLPKKVKSYGKKMKSKWMTAGCASCM